MLSRTKGKVRLQTELQQAITSFSTQLKRRQLVGSSPVARKMLELIRLVVSCVRWNKSSTLMDIVKDVGDYLIAAHPLELVIGNVVRRVLHMIREEEQSAKKKNIDDFNNNKNIMARTKSVQNFFEDFVADDADCATSSNIKTPIIEGINELIDELDSIYSNVAEHAPQHIHSGEVILTYGKSKTVEEFLKEAHMKKRHFSVIVAEGAPTLDGPVVAKKLAELGIPTTVIPDSAIFAVMSRVDKVIVGTHAVLANGGLLGPAGLNAIALAAKYKSVPFIVCTGLFKLSPLHPSHADAFYELKAPAGVLPFDEFDCRDNADVESPMFDYVPPEVVTLFLTNGGGHHPTAIYRILTEYYSAGDYLWGVTS
eukprot:TRINITY_DN8908_c0_g1::TRINITY_DN8908_c0_g1_i1::g.19056::m.19056 TRINITY_DN8908_c0_g1::TRINITY_DN8908_c0_g1_i1::g.19056  ORF type:complete len:368 (+),score=82.32,sp/Q54EY2/EI2BB_DICDI/43.56/2e-99,IF-2B/PF01008.12/3.9e-73 TRINITY_DN8908_c0_g1_i1:98-1201(+)